MAPHPSILAWRIPWTEEPGGLQSMGSHRTGHDWRDLVLTHCILNLRGPDVKLSKSDSMHDLEEGFNFQILCFHTTIMELIILGIISHLQNWDSEESKHIESLVFKTSPTPLHPSKLMANPLSYPWGQTLCSLPWFLSLTTTFILPWDPVQSS